MNASTLRRQLAVFGDLMPGKQYLHHFQVFLFIAEQGSVTYRQVEDEFHISNASASRIICSLGSVANHRKETMDLVQVTADPAEGRRLKARLTKKGRLIYDQILES